MIPVRLPHCRIYTAGTTLVNKYKHGRSHSTDICPPSNARQHATDHVVTDVKNLVGLVPFAWVAQVSDHKDTPLFKGTRPCSLTSRSSCSSRVPFSPLLFIFFTCPGHRARENSLNRRQLDPRLSGTLLVLLSSADQRWVPSTDHSYLGSWTYKLF
jgi:hypothetical protein